MAEFRTRQSFEKAFKKYVHNFDETKIWFIHPSRFIAQSEVCFVQDGVLCKFHMFKSQHSIDIWGNHFIDFLNTGKFDYNAYWQIYGNMSADKTVYKFPMCETPYSKFSEHSPESIKFLSAFRIKYGDAGMKLVSKPLN